MPAGARPAVLLAALLCLALAIPAAAAERPPLLVAQIAQATPEATPESQPPLSDEPPTALGEGSGDEASDDDGDDDDAASGSGSGSGSGSRSESRPLPDTGSEAAMLAL